MDNPLEDPTFVQGTCKHCGVPVESSSYNVIFNKYGAPLHGRNAAPHRWDHVRPKDDVDFELLQMNMPDLNHEPEPSDNRTHDQDAERQARENELNHVENVAKFSRQFDEYKKPWDNY